MNGFNPVITVQNQEGTQYLVRFQHDFGNGETMDITVSIPKGNHTLGELSRLTLARLMELAKLITPSE